MADLGLHAIDRTVQETNRDLKEITDELGWEDCKVAYHALRGVLFTLPDRLTPDLAANFGAQLPTLVGGIYYEGYQPAKHPEKYRTMDEWNQRVAQYLDAGAKNIDVKGTTRAVFRMMIH